MSFESPGFIGSNIVRELVKLDFNVVIFGLSDIKQSRINDLRGKVEFFKLDLGDRDAVKKTLKDVDPDMIIHLAANTNPDRSSKMIRIMMKDY